MTSPASIIQLPYRGRERAQSNETINSPITPGDESDGESMASVADSATDMSADNVKPVKNTTSFLGMPGLDDKYKQREYMKGRLAAAFRIFAKYGYDEGTFKRNGTKAGVQALGSEHFLLNSDPDPDPGPSLQS